MNFVDDVVLTLAAGNGGSGLMHLRHLRYIAKGGPDGGDGGRGGSVYVKATTSRQTLGHLTGLKSIKATSGKDGGVNLRSGHSGEDVTIEVPVGTVITDVATHKTLYDLTQNGAQVTIAQGGKGGRGNWHFRSSTNQTPEEFELGTPGERLTAHFTLKLVADVGLVGMPNAGKSTLINVLTNAKSKVGSYPFTTINPNLGVLHTPSREVVIADIPGLIEGASDGKGLGHSFLRHIERTSVITYLIPADTPDPKADLVTLMNELHSYNTRLTTVPVVVVLTKCDLAPVDYQKIATRLSKAVHQNVIPVSAHTNVGLPDLVKVWQAILDSKNGSV